MLPQELQRRLDERPRVRLAFLPTPLQDAPNLSRALGGPRILIKRDDMTGLAFGGNKARKLEFLLADARAHGADSVILSAGAQSNMVRMTAAGATTLGMGTYLVLRGASDGEPIQGNLLLDRLFDAQITFISTKNPYSQISVDVMSDLASQLKEQGKTPYIIDLRYHSAPLAALGYLLAAVELEQQFQVAGVEPTHVFLPAGSGTTQTGLLLGATILDSGYKVVGISVQKSQSFISPRIKEKLESTCNLLEIANPVSSETIIVDDRWIGEEYGVPSAEGIEAMKLVARTDAVVLGPTYSGKAMAGLIGWVRERRLSRDDVAVFLHTGGTPALFAAADQLAPSF